MNELMTPATSVTDDAANMLATVDAFLADGQERRYELAAVLALIDMEPTADEVAQMGALIREDYETAVRVLSVPQQRQTGFSAHDRLAVVGRLGAVRDRRLGVLRLADEVLHQAH